MAGSDDATTCLLLVLENPANCTFSIAHLDSTKMRDSLLKMVIDVLDVDASSDPPENICSVCLELSVFGGYMDERMYSEKLTLNLLQFFHQLQVRIKLKMACVGLTNTRFKDGINWPIVYGIVVNLRADCSISPAFFGLKARGPSLALRSARLFCNQLSLYRWLSLKTIY